MSNYSACLQTACIDLGCASNVGGITEIYLVAGDITGVTYNSVGSVTGITGTGTTYTYSVQKQTSSLTETFNSDLVNGTLFYTQDLVLVFQKMDQQKRNQVRLMAQNRGLKAFALDNNGTYWFLGNDFGGGFLSAGTGATGTAFGDSNSYSVTLQFFSRDPMTTLASTLSAALAAGSITIASC
jgi:hypothetical protein